MAAPDWAGVARGLDRPSGEPTPWVTGLMVSAIFAVFIAFLLVGVYELVGQLAQWVGVGAVGIVCIGVGWTLWDLRDRPVWRWIVWGTMIGLLAGIGSSIALLTMGR
ncbi:DUF2537 domain-containing protein [Gordonia soli]|uniref:DUF2537 domain-containing protein n=1 Tax=Gordonia soli TaxID=320799 RepID=UPI0006922C05|nr:DUF2537 domain-containing protein [Gordonia soli]